MVVLFRNSFMYQLVKILLEIKNKSTMKYYTILIFLYHNEVRFQLKAYFNYFVNMCAYCLKCS